MDTPNAFIGWKEPPAANEVEDRLGSSVKAWKELLAWLAEQNITGEEWRSVSPKYGWGLRPALKKRTILYLGPCEGCFRASFVLGDRAVAEALNSDLPKTLLKELAGARRYVEGTGLHLLVSKPEDLDSVRKLVEIKLKY